jgi:hypothetical protein
MSSGGKIYVPSFIKIGSRIQTLLGENSNTDTRTQDGLINFISFFQNKESRPVKLSFLTNGIIVSNYNNAPMGNSDSH